MLGVQYIDFSKLFALAGRSSVEQDDEVVRKMRQTPRTPMKTLAFGKNGLSSAQRRRGLFQPESPAVSEKSGSLGHMSPLSSSLEVRILILLRKLYSNYLFWNYIRFAILLAH